MSSPGANKNLIHKILPVFIFVGGMVMSFCAYSIHKEFEQQKLETAFIDRAKKISVSVNNWMNLNNEILESIEAFFNASQLVDRTGFHNFVSGYLHRHKNLRSLAWIPRVKDSEREQYRLDAVEDGWTAFDITEKKADQFVPAHERDEYFPVYYRESLHENPSIMGFDMASDPVRRPLLLDAMDQNKILMGGLIELMIKDDPQKGFLVFNPVYKRNTPLDTVEQRRENLLGFVTGGYIIRDIAKNLLRENEFKNINVIVLDTTSKDHTEVIYNSLPEQKDITPLLKDGGALRKVFNNKISYSHTLNVGGRNWKIIASPMDSFYSSMQTAFPVMVLAFGLILSVLISLILKSNMDKTAEVERQVLERTKDLTEKEKILNNTVLELRVSHKKLKEAQDQLIHNKKLASIGQMAAGVAHEINNPLAFLCSNLEILDQYSSQISRVIKNIQTTNGTSTLQAADVERLFEGVNKEDVYFFVDDIKGVLKESNEGLDRIKGIVTQLRTFSRDRDDDTVIPVKLENLVENVLKIVKSDVLVKVDLVKDFALNQKVPCEPQKIEQVLLNILTNALQAIPEKGRIDIRTFAKDGFACVEIKDSGVGIPEQELDKIFDPFFTTKPVGVGTGLGLSISYDIIKKHHGDIKVESIEGKGTTFRIMLPLEEKS